MGDKKPNRISSLLGGAATKKSVSLAHDLGEEDENPAEEDGAVDDAAKKEAGARLRAALSANDDVGIYEAVCRIYDLESGAGGAGAGPEDEEEPYAGAS